MKRFFRLRLKTLLILFTIVAIWLGFYVRSARQQQAAVHALGQLGGWSYYDYQIVKGSFDPNAKSWVPDWIRLPLGNDFFHSVVSVNLVYNDDGPKRIDNGQTTGEALQYVGQLSHLKELLLKEGQANDDNLRYLSGLSHLRRLYMWDAAEVSDLGIQQLAGLRNLEYVHCSNAHLTDVSLAIFGQMPKLNGLSLQGNRFSDRGLERLKSLSKLESLWVGTGDTHITDTGLKYVYGLKKLREFEFYNAPVTETGIQELRTALPKLTIYHGIVENPKPKQYSEPPPAGAPQLCFLSDQHDPPDDDKEPWPGTYWRPDGTIVEKKTDLIPLRTTEYSTIGIKQPLLNIFLMVQDVEHHPSTEIDMLDDAGKPLHEQWLALTPYSGKVTKDADHFWQHYPLIVPEHFKLPQRGTIRVRYAHGNWQELATFPASDEQSLLNARGVSHVATGDDGAGNAFVSLYIQSPEGDKYQYELSGRDKKKSTIRSSGMRQAGDLRASYVITFEFPAPRSKFTEFVLLHRPKYTATYEFVSFHPGMITTPAMRQPDGTLTATQQQK